MALLRRVLAFLSIALLGVTVAIAAEPSSLESERSYPALFGTSEVRNPRLTPFQKWTGMLSRLTDEQALYEGTCSERRFNRCHLQEWRAMLQELAGKDRLTQLTRVNEYLNKAPYIEDPTNYGVPDYWATPMQFMNRDGDCEDYAIAKFLSLRELGFARDELRVVIVDDLNLKVPHAVLAVYLPDRTMILDNQIAQVVPATVIRHYRPIYSINEDAWWLHRPQ